MTDTTLLLRQIHPTFVQAGFVTSQAFRPTPKDQGHLSVYDGDLIRPPEAFAHYTTVWKLAAIGTLALSVAECHAESVPCRPDPLEDCPQHALVDFTEFTSNQCEKISKKLKKKAEVRGWLYQVSAGS